MSQFPQAPCPHCQAPVNWYSPGCFNCKQPIQWPAPQNPDQSRMQLAAVAFFQEQLAAWRAQQAQQAPMTAPSHTPAPAPPARPAGFGNPVTIPPTDGNLGSLVESTHFASVQYDPQAAEDVEGFSSGTFGEFVPRDLPVQRIDDLEATRVQQNGAAAIVTAADAVVQDVEQTAFANVDAGHVAPAPDMELASFSAVTAQAAAQTAGADPLVERTAVTDHVRATPAPTRKKAASMVGKRICKDCGTVGDRERCPTCGAMTKEWQP